jgi:hypothetical protein
MGWSSSSISSSRLPEPSRANNTGQPRCGCPPPVIPTGAQRGGETSCSPHTPSEPEHNITSRRLQRLREEAPPVSCHPDEERACPGQRRRNLVRRSNPTSPSKTNNPFANRFEPIVCKPGKSSHSTQSPERFMKSRGKTCQCVTDIRHSGTISPCFRIRKESPLGVAFAVRCCYRRERRVARRNADWNDSRVAMVGKRSLCTVSHPRFLSNCTQQRGACRSGALFHRVNCRGVLCLRTAECL